MQRRRRGVQAWLPMLIFVLVVTAIMSGLAYKIKTSSGSGHYRTVVLDRQQKITGVTDGFLVYDGSTLLKYNEKGSVAWSHLLGENGGYETTPSGIAAWSGRNLTLMSHKGSTEYLANMSAEILSAKIYGGKAAVVLAPDHNSTIVLMETSGRTIDSITLTDQTVIDYGFFYNNDLFWVMTLDTNGTVPNCTVSTYRPGRRMVGSVSDSTQVLYHTSFLASEILCVGDSYIKGYSYNGTEDLDRRRMVYGWTLVDSHDSADACTMAFVLNGEYDPSSSIRDVRLIRGNYDRTIRMPFGCIELVARADRVYGFSADGHIMTAYLDRQKVETQALNLSYDTVYGVTDSGTAITGIGNTIYLIQL